MGATKNLRTAKRVVAETTWGAGKVPAAAFPLLHTGPISLSKAWNWCVYTLADSSYSYRLLVAFEPGKRQYKAWLGVTFGADQALIGRVEFHASHDGWHCHWKTGLVENVGRGAVKAPHSLERRRHCRGEARDLSKAVASSIAFNVFNVVGHDDTETLL